MSPLEPLHNVFKELAKNPHDLLLLRNDVAAFAKKYGLTSEQEKALRASDTLIVNRPRGVQFGENITFTTGTTITGHGAGAIHSSGGTGDGFLLPIITQTRSFNSDDWISMVVRMATDGAYLAKIQGLLNVGSGTARRGP